VLLIADAVVLFGGLYNVAASSPHWPPVTMLIEFAVQRSVSTYSLAIDAVPILDDRDRQVLGARHFERQCASCHGSPSSPPAALSRNMLPAPPGLTSAVGKWTDRELFWIVEHGLKFTGMPAWTTQDRADEVWSMVAFLRILPDLDADAYRAIAGGGTRPVAVLDTPAAADCAACHGDAGSAPVSRLIPLLHGQKQDYLVRALREYRARVRPSGYMQPVAAALSDEDIVRLAAYYSGLERPPPRQQRADAGTGPSGRSVAAAGLPGENVPACLACHDGASSYPILAGQPAPYLEAQLELWRRGVRGGTAHGAIMTPIAQRLPAEQAAGVARFFEFEAPPPREAALTPP
jgi:cytochrome c553